MRQIYIVDAVIVDANGAFNHLNGYPKIFDSKNYEYDADKALKRATGDFSEAFGGMCKIDTRQLQTVTLMTADGFMIDSKHLGQIAQPEPAPEPNTESE